MSNSRNNHFFFSYCGNKRNEFKDIYKHIIEDIDNKCIDTIVEPYSGSCAFSVLMSIQFPKRFKYIINDLDENLIKLFHLCRNKTEWILFVDKFNEIVQTITSKDAYLKAIGTNDFMGWFIGRKITTRARGGLYPLKYKPQLYSFDKTPIVTFLQEENIEILNKSGLDVYKDNALNCRNLVFVDPPYMCSDNSSYKHNQRDIYEYCSYNNIKHENAFIVFSLGQNWIVDLLFSSCRNYITYDKQYGMGCKKKVKHVLISN
jgi:site-specific DNA-adenine methylase